MKIAVYYLASPKTGGWVTYIMHLFKALRLNGLEPILIRPENTKKIKSKSFCNGVELKIVPTDMVYNLVNKMPSLIVAMELKDESMNMAKRILSKPNGTIIHHGSGQTPDASFFKSICKSTKHIAVRKTIKKKINDFGFNCTYLAHPYESKKVDNESKYKCASISRVDFVKNTHLIVAANKVLEEKIQIYGTENRLYSHFKIKETDINWKENYLGEFNAGAAKFIARQYESIIDLTRIKNDGGGLQYTHLEAIDSGCALILHKDWVTPKGSLFQHGFNCFAVADEKELIELLSRERDFKTIHKNSLRLMELHNIEKCGAEFKEIIMNKGL